MTKIASGVTLSNVEDMLGIMNLGCKNLDSFKVGNDEYKMVPIGKRCMTSEYLYILYKKGAN
jgi:hypothetical protein